MRRVYTATILFVFILQSSGMATAAALRPPAALLTTASALRGLLREGFITSRIAAALNGRQSLWDQAHEPAPTFPAPLESRKIMQITQGIRPRFPRVGTVILAPHETRPHNLPVDPRALNAYRAASFPQRGEHRKASSTRRALSVSAGLPPVTGITRWWQYERGSIPGGGRWLVNIGTGNYIVKHEDMHVRHKGIDLTFERTYNSMSAHDYSNTDGSGSSNYGDGWTSTFDAHVALNNSGGISVFDTDGARYDYSANSAGGWTPPAGQHAVLKSDSNGNYNWIQKNGVTFSFYSPSLPQTQSALPSLLFL